MLNFNASQFLESYPAFAAYSVEQLTDLYYNEALILGANLLSLFTCGIPAQTWNASTNTPTLTNGVSGANNVYLCTVAGSVDFGAGTIQFGIYNLVQYNVVSGTWNNTGTVSYYYWSCVVLAHVLTLMGTNPAQINTSVGRVDNAGEGTVSGAFTFEDTINGTWWNQTQYGSSVCVLAGN